MHKAINIIPKTLMVTIRTKKYFDFLTERLELTVHFTEIFKFDKEIFPVEFQVTFITCVTKILISDRRHTGIRV